MGLIDDLGPGPVGLDTTVFIYFVEEHAEFHEVRFARGLLGI